MKKIATIALEILLILLSYLLQICVINNTSFFGITGNLCLMTIVLIALLEKTYVTYIMAVMCGMVSDILFSDVICKYVVVYIIVVSILIELKKIYKQDSKLAIIVFSIVATFVNNILLFIFNLISTGQFVNIFIFILNILKECIINIFLSFMLYLVFRLMKKESK